MGNVKSIPIIGEGATIIESSAKIIGAGVCEIFGEKKEAKKLVKGAGNAWVEYSEKNLIVGTLNAAGHAICGDKKEARRVGRSVVVAVESVADSTPVVGHVKGVVHYALGETEHGNECMIGASRSTAVLGAGLLTGGLGAGAAAGGLAGLGSGVAYDGVHSAIDSGVKNERSTHGIWNIDRDAQACESLDDVLNLELAVVGSALGDFVAGSTAAKAGKDFRNYRKGKTQQNKIKSAYKEVAEESNIDVKHAYRDTLDAARNLDQQIKDGTVKGDGHVSTRVRNIETGEVNQGYNSRARTDMNVKNYETNGKQSGFSSKTQAKKARLGPSELMKQNSDVIHVMSERAQDACAEHSAFNEFYKKAPSGSAPATAQVVSVQKLNGLIKTVQRCANCKSFGEAMGIVVTDFAPGLTVPVNLTHYIRTAFNWVVAAAAEAAAADAAAFDAAATAYAAFQSPSAPLTMRRAAA